MPVAAHTEFDVRLLPGLINPDVERIALAKQRQTAVWRGETPDKWPIIMHGPLTAQQEAIPSANYEEAFYDNERMLCSQMRHACAVANSGSDAVPSIRGNFGTATILACLGLEQDIFPDKMPWLQQRLSADEIAKLEPDDITIRGTFERGLEFMRYAREILVDSCPLYCMDTQGPLDLAHLVMGDEIFYAMYDDPPLVHHLLDIVVETNIRAHTWMKEASGEPLTRHVHGCAMYTETMGIRICEDTTAIIGRDAMDEFALPYTRQLARHFGGAWVHYCGRADYLSEAACNAPEIRAVNFGHVPGHEHDHPFEQDMQRCRDTGTVYWGSWPRRSGETGEQYLRRMYEWASQGYMVCQGGAAVGDNGFATVAEALEFWYAL